MISNRIGGKTFKLIGHNPNGGIATKRFVGEYAAPLGLIKASFSLAQHIYRRTQSVDLSQPMGYHQSVHSIQTECLLLK